MNGSNDYNPCRALGVVMTVTLVLGIVVVLRWYGAGL